MQRRTFLRLIGAAGAAAIVPACGGDDAASPAASPSAAAPGPTPTANAAIQQVAPEAEQSITVIAATFEQLVGKGQTFAFGLTDLANEPIKGADAQLFVVPDGGEPSGPFATRYEEVEGVPLGLYVTEIDVTQAGPTSLVAVTSDNRAGVAQVSVAEPAQSQVAAPGTDAIAAATATEEEPGELAELCTRQPPCGMHEVSLDDALKQGRPVMLTFATPAYCQTAVCGPSVDVVERVRTSGDFGKVAWIHVEIYSDEGKTLAEPVKEWQLPSEPWLFAIGSDGKIAGRADGPLLVLPDHVESLAEGLA